MQIFSSAYRPFPLQPHGLKPDNLGVYFFLFVLHCINCVRSLSETLYASLHNCFCLNGRLRHLVAKQFTRIQGYITLWEKSMEVLGGSCVGSLGHLRASGPSCLLDCGDAVVQWQRCPDTCCASSPSNASICSMVVSSLWLLLDKISRCQFKPCSKLNPQDCVGMCDRWCESPLVLKPPSQSFGSMPSSGKKSS